MKKNLSLLLAFVCGPVLLSSSIWAKDYTYQGKVEGMVCAFCAYNVSKKIGQLPEIDASSVKVELKSGRINFLSSSLVKKTIISKLFADSGFSLVSLTLQKNSDLKSVSFSNEPVVTLVFSRSEIEALDSILDDIGNMAAAQVSRLTINAPKISEIDVLKPILAGRQRTIEVQFMPAKNDIIELRLYQAATSDK